MLKVFSHRGSRTLSITLLLAATLGLSATLYIAQTPAARTALPTHELPPLAVGDWVFRSGTSRESHLIQTLSNSDFSRIGMVVSLHPEPIIVHATTDDDPQRSNQVLSSTLTNL